MVNGLRIFFGLCIVTRDWKLHEHPRQRVPCTAISPIPPPHCYFIDVILNHVGKKDPYSDDVKTGAVHCRSKSTP
jgi:hypothetical protein